jgi:hypothetical protein
MTKDDCTIGLIKNEKREGVNPMSDKDKKREEEVFEQTISKEELNK